MRRMYSKPQLLEAVEQEAEVNGLKAFENIVDKDGHKRFIEGEGTPLSLEGFTASYCKWALSGTHLMFVIAGTIASGTTITGYPNLAVFKLPEWIYNKIYPVWLNYIESKTITLYAENWTNQTMQIGLAKGSGTNINIPKISGDITLSAERSFRIAFDLVIDNE